MLDFSPTLRRTRVLPRASALVARGKVGANPEGYTLSCTNCLGIEIGIRPREKLGHDVASMKAPWGDLKLEEPIRVVPG